MLTTLGLLTVTLAGGATPDLIGSTAYRPRIELWTNHGDAVYSRGQHVRVYFRVDEDAYVTIFRVDTDGRIRVLFPHDPWEDNYARGGRDFEVDSRGRRAGFRIDDYPGVGYIFAVASADPFMYDPFVRGDHWDYRVISDGRVRGDPYVALTELAAEIVPPQYDEWDYDLVPYHVERHYDYPRFLCYDCHSYVSWSHWNPYRYSCTSFRIVVYNDPWYYPYRYYRGTRVIFTRPYRPDPRYIFKTRSAGEVFITQARKRPDNERGVRGRDLGGVVATPRRRSPNDPQQPGGSVQPDRRDGREVIRPDRPDSPERPGRTERSDVPGQTDRLDRAGRTDQPERIGRGDRPDHASQPERQDQPQNDRPDRRERIDGTEDRSRPQGSERSDRPWVEPPTRPQSGAGDAARPRTGSPDRREPQRTERVREGQPPASRTAPRENRGGREPARAAPREDRGRSQPGDAPKRSEPELKRRKS
jgi:hypothetical protein